jgi:cell division inhibitor SepF
MGALQKVKAYFGMIPVDELDEYPEDYDSPRGRYGHAREPVYHGGYGMAEGHGGYSAGREPSARDFGEPVGDDRPLPPPPRANRIPARNSWGAGGGNGGGNGGGGNGGGQPTVRGALAVEPEYEPVSQPRPAPERSEHPLSRITTLHPSSYNEARTIGEHYRDGIPVIMNLTDMDDADAKRLVDFAAGLAFALRGSMDKVTNKVFLISPPDVDVTEQDRKRIAEGGFLKRG